MFQNLFRVKYTHRTNKNILMHIQVFILSEKTLYGTLFVLGSLFVEATTPLHKFYEFTLIYVF